MIRPALPVPTLSDDEARRFDAKIDRTETCWLWTGAVTSRGYGCVGIAGRTYLAHRVSYVRHKGPIPPGLQIDHRCYVKRCVRPHHLEAVTASVNSSRRRPGWTRTGGSRTRTEGSPPPPTYRLPDPPPKLYWGDTVLYEGQEAFVLRSSNAYMSIILPDNRVLYDVRRGTETILELLGA